MDNTIKNERRRILNEMKKVSPGDVEYERLLRSLTELSKASTLDLTVTNPIIVTTVAQLAGLILVLNFERLGIITTRALSFLPKIKN